MLPKTRSFPSSTSKETALEGGSVTGGPGQHKEGPCGRWVPWQHLLGAGYMAQSATLRQTVSPRPNPRGQSCETSKHPGGCCTCQPPAMRDHQHFAIGAWCSKTKPSCPQNLLLKLLPSQGAQAVINPHLHFPVLVLQIQIQCLFRAPSLLAGVARNMCQHN